ncbi:hypothetical protein J4421_06115 [Candidatus Woesearchaeota archaeon]|nr:hypothetical protein [Candidatus Woesearchaeota archaeon]
MENRSKKIEELFRRGILAKEDLLAKEITSEVLDLLEQETDLLVLNADDIDAIAKQTTLVNWYEIDSSRVAAEKERDDELYQASLQLFKKSSLSLNPSPVSTTKHDVSSLETTIEENAEEVNFTTSIHFTNSIDLFQGDEESKNLSPETSKVTIVLSYENKPHKYDISDFTRFFISRHSFLEGLLRQRRELQHTLTINRILGKKERENISLIGIIEEITKTKTGNLIISIEDLTGRIKIIISKNKKDLFRLSQDLIVDEVVGITGKISDGVVFVENIFWPDIPSNHELKKSERDDYVLFLSDVHVGSALFLEEEFERFIQWLNGSIGNETQRGIASKVKYIFIAGDLVDGVGVYPSQEEELKIKDIKEQYREFSRLIRQIPTANPAVVNIGKTSTFPGFDVLMYHGFSFDYYVANVDSIRLAGGYHRADMIMKFLLKRRHLAPAFKSTPYCPSYEEDPLLIKIVPDFFVTGHIHYSCVANYHGITMISGSCWQNKTTFQEKLGHEPEPARVPAINLKTREIKILRF